jgi:hypothetical protein
MGVKKDHNRVLSLMSLSYPFDFSLVEAVYEITKSYDKTIEVLEMACAENKDPIWIASEGIGCMKKTGEIGDRFTNHRFDFPNDGDIEIMNDNEWKELNLDNVDWSRDGNIIRYRKRQPEQKEPSHEEIMTKWWKTDEGKWIKVIGYSPKKPVYYRFLVGTDHLDAMKEWFTCRESATIPPEK